MRLFQIRYKRVLKYGNIFKRTLNNLVYFNISNTVISISVIDWNKINEYEIALGCFQLIITVIHMIVIFRCKRIYMIQVDIEDYIYEI